MSKEPHHNRTLAVSMAMIVVGMLMLSYAAVPLYKLFCQVTGFGGTTQTAGRLPDHILDREITVTFNADLDSNLDWRFKPLQHSIKVKVGETALVAYEAENLSNVPVTATATYNITPFDMGPYFHKIQCFCFEAQTLQPGSVVNMPISFYIDPEMDQDPYLKDVKNITLSYTFYNQLSKNAAK